MSFFSSSSKKSSRGYSPPRGRKTEGGCPFFAKVAFVVLTILVIYFVFFRVNGAPPISGALSRVLFRVPPPPQVGSSSVEPSVVASGFVKFDKVSEPNFTHTAAGSLRCHLAKSGRLASCVFTNGTVANTIVCTPFPMKAEDAFEDAFTVTVFEKNPLIEDDVRSSHIFTFSKTGASAKWSIVSFPITYDANGDGITSVVPAPVLADKAVITLPYAAENYISIQ